MTSHPVRRPCETSNVALSVVLRVVGGLPFLRRCLTQLVPQLAGRRVEVIVPYEPNWTGIADLSDEFPEVCLLPARSAPTEAHRGTATGTHETYDRLTALGLSRATGQVVAILEDYGIPAPDWCDQVLTAHRLPPGVIGGAVEHQGRGLLNWAIYFLDFGRYQLPFSEGPADFLTDVNVSYKRVALDSVRELWAERYNEVTVHWALLRQGEQLWRRPQIVVGQDRGRLSFADQIRERIAWGSVFGAARVREMKLAGRLGYIAVSPALPIILMLRLARLVFARRRNRAWFVLALPQIGVMASLWCFGELVAYVTGRSVSSTRKSSPQLRGQRAG